MRREFFLKVESERDVYDDKVKKERKKDNFVAIYLCSLDMKLDERWVTRMVIKRAEREGEWCEVLMFMVKFFSVD